MTNDPTPGEPPSIRTFEALGFLFKTEDALANVGMAFVFSLIPLVGPIALMGWYAEVLARLEENHPKPVPRLAFDDLMTYMNRGVPAFVAQLVAVMPLSLVIGAGAGLLGAVVSIATAASAPRHGHPAPIDPTIVGAIALGGILFFLLLLPFFGIVTNAAATRAELVGDVGEALKFGAIFDYARATWAPVLVSGFLYGIVSTVVIILGLAACFVGIYPAVVVVRLGKVHLRHQIYRRYLAEGGTPIPIKARDLLPSEKPRPP